ncbi:MT-A70-domain-containing protein [Mycena maculata]|uniref:MT-A70-domain-containing protein n=1 Tax=Mycena maculata TaxID=230809 RepID=A0AAD7K3B2_9AGAR|nr:MT-A70-domain-containing protein [Mycena maculata]
MATTTEVTSSANDLLAAHSALILQVRTAQQSHRRQLRSLQFPPSEILELPLIPSLPPSPVDQGSAPPSPTVNSRLSQIRAGDLPPAKRARVTRYKNYVPEEETIRNDYSQRYVDGGEWPQNWVLGADPEHRFEEYPKQQRLLRLKQAAVNCYSVAPSYLPFSELQTLHSKFDVILLDPPFSSSFTWEHLQDLPIPALAADPSFIFLWVGSGAGEGLESGREVLAKWGYRRCEDVVWVKTNKTTNRGPGTDPPTNSLLTRTKQHCLIGIRGTVRRSTDSWFVHCNVDTDVIFWEGDPSDPTRKPPEMYTLIENFCLGTRRLELFGRAPSSLRRGWVTALAPGQEGRLPPEGAVYSEDGAVASRWDREAWDIDIKTLANGGKTVVPMTPDIDALRPKSPFRPGAPGAGGNAAGPGGARFAGGSRGGFAGAQSQSQVQNPGLGPGQGQIMGPMMMMNPMGVGMGMGGGMSGGDGMMRWPGMMGGMGVPMGAGGMAGPMMGQMGMGYGFNGAMAGGWGDQSQYVMGDQNQYGMEGVWDDGMVGGMDMTGMNAMAGAGMGMGQQQWGNGGTYEGYL